MITTQKLLVRPILDINMGQAIIKFGEVDLTNLKTKKPLQLLQISKRYLGINLTQNKVGLKKNAVFEEIYHKKGENFCPLSVKLS